MAKVAVFVVFAVCMVVVNSHMCIFSPRQRGSLQGVNKPGSDSCIRMQGPCGNQARGKPVEALVGGKKFTVVFQKNLNHWTKNPPHGMFNISFAPLPSGKRDPKANTFTHLASVPDTNTPNLWVYSQDVMIPKQKHSVTGVLQVIYITANKHAPPAFYQCADIMIM